MPSHEAIQTWTTAIDHLDQWLQSTHMAPEIRKEIINGLRTWQKDEPMQTTPTTSEAAEEQTKLGWDLALEGCLSRKWHSQQETFWKVFWTRQSSRRWMSELIKKLLGVAWDMWQQWNEALHEKQDNRPCILEAETNTMVTALYELSPSAFANSISLFKHSLPHLLSLLQAYKKHWVETAAIRKARQDCRKARPYQGKCRAMQIWLTTFNSMIT